jgi:adenosine deaminase
MKTPPQATISLAEALCSGDMAAVASVPKTDLHSHWLYGARIEAFEEYAGHSIPRPPSRMKSIKEMVTWARANLWTVFKTHLAYHKFALKASFEQAKNDGVRVLEMSVDAGICAATFNGDADKLAKSLRDIHRKVAPEIDFIPELSIKGETEVPFEFLQSCFATGYFGSLDLYAVEDQDGSYGDYKKIYRMAKKAGLKLKAHVGEFGPAQLVKSAVEILELDAVQHGISAADSASVMRWLAKGKIQLNVCPSSNVMLKRVDKMKNHPIGILHKNGVRVTINTDDLAVFGQSVSEEYINLYRAKVLTAQELEAIRLIGLSNARS